MNRVIGAVVLLAVMAAVAQAHFVFIVPPAKTGGKLQVVFSDSLKPDRAELLKKKGARQIIACVSHAILNDQGVDRLRKSVIDELITTDTVLRPAIKGVKITSLSVAGLLGEAIKRIHNNSSVTSLFESKGGRTS